MPARANCYALEGIYKVCDIHMYTSVTNPPLYSLSAHLAASAKNAILVVAPGEWYSCLWVQPWLLDGLASNRISRAMRGADFKAYGVYLDESSGVNFSSCLISM